MKLSKQVYKLEKKVAVLTIENRMVREKLENIKKETEVPENNEEEQRLSSLQDGIYYSDSKWITIRYQGEEITVSSRNE